MAKIGCWIEAMRLRTLPVSVAGVIAAAAFALMNNKFEATPVLLCLSFAILAQIASNFANEYFDFKAGLDKPGRVGPRRGVTEGDITPKAMKNATYGTLALACLIGLSLVHWGGFWLIAVGLAIAVGVLAYSAGPYPLSQHALGEVAVLFFFGIIPVNFTYYLQAGAFDLLVFYGSIGIGLMGANVLIVNNYRDLEADQDVDKYTLAVAIGRHRIAGIYLINGWLAVALMMPAWTQYEPWKMIFPVIYVVLHSLAHNAIIKRRGTALNPMLGITAMLMLLYCLGFLLATAL